MYSCAWSAVRPGFPIGISSTYIAESSYMPNTMVYFQKVEFVVIVLSIVLHADFIFTINI